MPLNDMQVFNNQVQVVATETVAQAVRRFNEASGGAMVLGDQTHIGDFLEEASYKLIANLVNRRDAYADGDVSSQNIQQLLDRSVKVDSRVGPVRYTAEQFRRLGKSPEESGLVIGEQAAEAMIQDYLNTAIGAAVNAIEDADQGGDLVHDGSGSKPTLKLLNRAAALFGDRSQALVAWVMTGQAFHDIIEERIDNQNRLFEIGNISVVTDGLGRRFVVTDSPQLTTDDSVPLQRVVGLTPGGIAVQTAPMISETDTQTLKENIAYIWQGEYSFTVGLNGYSWNDAAKRSPTDAQLFDGTNWDKVVTSNKDTAGVVLLAD